MNLTNQALTNVFTKALINNVSSPRYARYTFTDLVSATVLSKSFQRSIKAADSLFGIEEENKTIARKIRKVTRKVKAVKRHAKKHAKISKVDAPPADPNAPKPKRGRPKGSKNRPKPVETPVEIVESEPTITLES